MSALIGVLLAAVAALLLAGGAAFLALRGTGWRRRGAAAVAVVLALSAVGGLFWTTLPQHTVTNTVLAPVDPRVTLYAQGQVCGNVSLFGAGCTDQHMLYALSGTNGGLRWQQPAGSLHESQSVLLAGPDVLYSFVGSASGEGAGTLTAWRAVNGSQLWQRQLDVFPQQMALGGDRLMLFSPIYRDATTTVIELRASDGSQLLRRATLPVQGQFTVADGVIYGCEDGIAALRVADLGEVWHYFPTPPSRDTTVPVPSGLCHFIVADGVVFAEREQEAGFYALSATDGHLLWRSSPTVSAFVIGAGSGLVLSLQQLGGAGTPGIVALRATDGRQVWQYPAPSQDKLPATPGSGGVSLLAGDTVYLGGSTLTALRLSDGAALWKSTLPNYRFTVAAEASGVVFALAIPGNVGSPSATTYALALSARDGHEFWRTAASSERLMLECSVP